MEERSILIYDNGTNIGIVKVKIDPLKSSIVERICITLNGEEFDIWYMVDMGYGVVIPKGLLDVSCEKASDLVARQFHIPNKDTALEVPNLEI